MKNRAISYITLLLLAAMVTNSCGGDAPAAATTSSDAGETTPAETEYVDPFKDDLPEGLDFGGKEFHILTYRGANLPVDAGSWPGYMMVEEENGDLVNDTAYRRNRAVEERLNVKLLATETGDNYALNALQPMILAQEDVYSMVMPHSSEAPMSMISQNMFLDVNTMKYIDLAKPYYNPSVSAAFRVGDADYIIAGKYPYSTFPSVYLIYNKDKWAEYKFEDPYQLVRDGKWTHEKMMRFVKDTYQDLNGDGNRDINDFYGLATNAILYQYLYHSYGGKTIIGTKDGYEFGYGTEKAYNITEKIISLLNDPNTFETGNYDNFKQGNSLLCLYGSSFLALRDMEFDFGILPVPKYDEQQEEYITYLAGNFQMIPVTVSDTDFVGAVTEALYSESAKNMEDAFVQKYVENKLLRDEGSIEMYKLLTATAAYETSRYIDLSGGLIYNFKPIGNLISKGSADLASEWASVKEAVTSAYADFFAKQK